MPYGLSNIHKRIIKLPNNGVLVYRYLRSIDFNIVSPNRQAFKAGAVYVWYFRSNVYIWNENCVRQQHSFSRHEWMFLRKCQSF